MSDKKEKQQDPEPKVKMYRLKIDIEIEAESIDAARKQVTKSYVETFMKMDLDKCITRVVRAKYSSRADRLDEAKRMIDEARGIVEELKDEIETWKDNLPENLQNSDKYSALEDCETNLESVVDSLNDAESNCDAVEFPGMFD